MKIQYKLDRSRKGMQFAIGSDALEGAHTENENIDEILTGLSKQIIAFLCSNVCQLEMNCIWGYKTWFVTANDRKNAKKDKEKREQNLALS